MDCEPSGRAGGYMGTHGRKRKSLSDIDVVAEQLSHLTAMQQQSPPGAGSSTMPSLKKHCGENGMAASPHLMCDMTEQPPGPGSGSAFPLPQEFLTDLAVSLPNVQCFSSRDKILPFLFRSAGSNCLCPSHGEDTTVRGIGHGQRRSFRLSRAAPLLRQRRVVSLNEGHFSV